MLRLLRRVLPLIIAFGFSSCSSSEVTFSDSISEYSKESLLTIKKIEETKLHPELSDLLGDSVVVFSVFSDKNTPIDTAESLHHDVFTRVKEMTLFSSMVEDQRLNSLLNKNNQLAHAKEIYLDSLTTVSVSDKDISNPLGKYLIADNFLVFQLDRWPCIECNTPTGMRMKLRVVDAESCYIFWTAIVEIRKLSEEELNDLTSVAAKLTNQLTETFYNCFKKKWHRKRFEGLANS